MPDLRHVSASRVICAPADDAFDAITDIAHLPTWNAAVTRVVDGPEELAVGSEWTVEMHALGRRWHSRSRAETVDRIHRCFAYRSVTDDGNPSHVLWTWVVTDHPLGAVVTVAAELHPMTFWRRLLFVRVRARQLSRGELPRSLTSLERRLAPDPAALDAAATIGRAP